MSRALTILLQHAELERDQALAELQQKRAQVLALQQQTEQLQSYREETQARDPTRGGRSAGIEALLGHRNFMARLQQAQDLLLSQLQTAELHAQAAQADLLSQELRVAQVRKLQERRTLEVRKQTDQRDQRNSDEAAQQRLQHNRAQAQEMASQADAGNDHSRY